MRVQLHEYTIHQSIRPRTFHSCPRFRLANGGFVVPLDATMTGLKGEHSWASSEGRIARTRAVEHPPRRLQMASKKTSVCGFARVPRPCGVSSCYPAEESISR